MLQVDWVMRSVALGIAVSVSITISGLSTGLGAIFIDLRQQNPSAIISGFGGTLNLVLSLAYMFLAIVPFAMVFHMRATGHIGASNMGGAMALAGGWLALLTLALSVLPLILGARSLARREY